MRCRVLVQLVLATGLGAASMASPAQSTRLLDAAAVSDRDDHLDLSVDFSCSLRYQSHTPTSEGDELHVQLAIGPDCSLPPNAQFPVDRLLPAGTADLVRSIELQPGLTGGAELIIRWNRIEKFVLAPAAGMRGLRVRVQRTVAQRVVVDDSAQVPGSYAVNLESRQQPFDPLDAPKAGALLSAPVFVSERVVDGQTWYRLRAGPFTSRREAEQVLREARERYPGAWLGIDDEPPAEPLADGELAPVPPGPAGTRPAETREDAALDRLLDEARQALRARRFDDAVARLTQVIASQDYVHRIDAAELLGLARERKGQLAQAKAVYEDFLRRYPDGPAAQRIRQRLQTLRMAGLPGRRGSGSGADRVGWSGYGNASQFYRRDDSRLSSDALSRNLTTQNALLTDVDGLVRHRGEQYDFAARASMGYAKDLLQFGPGDQLRVSSAFVEVNDRSRGLGARLGRQSRGMAGLNGAFDGLLGTWQWRQNVGFNAAVGMPVESTRDGIHADRKFVAVATDLASARLGWDTAFYALAQQYGGMVDRRSIGFESRYLRAGRTLFAMADYDLHFGALNNVTVLGTLLTESRWAFNLDAGRQKSPLLSIRNALIGQPTLVFDDLTTQFTPDEIDQLARDRSASLTQLGLGAAHPLGDRGQWTLNLLSTDLSGTPASGGVAAVPGLGRDSSISTEFMINGLLRAGDTHSLALRYQDGGTGRVASIGVGSRLLLAQSWRLTSRLRLDRHTQQTDGSDEWVYVPSLRLDYQHGHNVIELEAGAELDRKALNAGGSEDTNRFFFSLGYRLTLDAGRR